MLNPQLVRNRPLDEAGGFKLLFEGRMSAQAVGLTTIAAATATAGHVFSARWNPGSGGQLCLVRYLALNWVLTTAFGAAQNMGWDVIVARGYTASHTGGTAIDMGSTTANTGSTRTATGTSLFTANSVRIGGSGALTAGTQTLDANSFRATQAWQGAVGLNYPTTALPNEALIDARDDGAGSVVRTPIVLANNEGFVIRNLVLMGATGVGTLTVTMEWEEYLPLS